MEEIYFVDSLHGWIVCEDSYYHEDQPYILCTQDGGLNWFGQESNTQQSLNDVYFTDLHNGWVVGDEGTLLITTNGGQYWELVDSPVNEDLHAVKFLDENTGFAAGNNGTLIRTTDGGITWNIIPLNSVINFRDMSIAGQKIWIIGDDEDSGDLFCSNDGGNTWLMTHTMITDNHWFSSIYFTDEDNGFLSECFAYNGGWYSWSGTIIMTTNDGGYTWRELDTINFDWIGSLSFCTANNGWAKGYRSTVYHTLDGGNSWNAQEGFEYQYFRSVYCLNEHNVWLLSNEKVYYTNDEGNQWQKQLDIIKDSFQSVFFIDPEKGWALGLNELLYTSNGGLDWDQTGGTSGGYDIFFTDELNGWIVENYGLIYHTSNGGSSWESQQSGTTQPLYDVFFTDQMNGWVAGGEQSYDGILLHTVDGGNSWQSIELSSGNYIYSIFFTDLNHGWLGCRNHVLFTTDGGETWDSSPLIGTDDYTPSSIFFADDYKGWAGCNEGVCFYTENGGLSWNLQNTGAESALRDIYFTDETHGWAVGGSYNSSAFITHTNDGGMSWELQCYDVGRWFTSVHFADEENGWAVGFSGVIIHTDNGGVVWTEEDPDEGAKQAISVYPNPSSGAVHLRYTIHDTRKTISELYSVQGIKVRILVDEVQQPGEYEIKSDISDLPDGLYFIRLQAGEMVETAKILLIK